MEKLVVDSPFREDREKILRCGIRNLCMMGGWFRLKLWLLMATVEWKTMVSKPNMDMYTAAEDEEDSRPSLMRRTTIGDGISILTELSLKRNNITAKGMSALSGFVNLLKLDLERCPLIRGTVNIKHRSIAGLVKIGCTQPRRLAAMSVATRLSQEMNVKLGHEEAKLVLLRHFVKKAYIVSRRRSARNGSGYTTVLEKELKSKLPGCNLEASPHIESSLKTFKKHCDAITDMKDAFGIEWKSAACKNSYKSRGIYELHSK
ncbi:hypothetical protein L1887_19992 [Cichorium endivia]|nr:hypothetical protein L1887_19992 [Cichorium endivia]